VASAGAEICHRNQAGQSGHDIERLAAVVQATRCLPYGEGDLITAIGQAIRRGEWLSSVDARLCAACGLL